MELKNLSFFPSYNNFLSSYNTLENCYLKKYRDTSIPLNGDEFTSSFFACFDFLSSLKKEDIDFLKTDINLHCKIASLTQSSCTLLRRIQALERYALCTRFSKKSTPYQRQGGKFCRVMVRLGSTWFDLVRLRSPTDAHQPTHGNELMWLVLYFAFLATRKPTPE